MDEREARARFAAAPLARLATVRPDGSPHVVPVVFAVEDDTVWLAVDEKPKRHRRLQRLANVRAEPRVSLLVDHEDEEWDRLWWVRADGRARIAEEGRDLDRATALLLARYPQERDRPPRGPAIVVAVDRWAWWEGSAAPR
jgi:PPOX class probable F420-dependent enzyme